MATEQDAFKLRADEQNILGRCIMIEEKCAALYRYFEKIHAEVPELAALWHTIALEEDGHAESFRLVGRLKGVGMEQLDCCDTNVTLLNEINEYLEANKRKRPSPVAALGFAINLERKLNEFHIGRSVLKFNDGALEKAFVDNMHWTREHVTTLENVLQGMV